MAAGAAHRHRVAAMGAQHRAQAFPEHQPADGGEQDDVGQRDQQIELAERAQPGEGQYPQRRADAAAGQQHDRQRRVDRAPSPVGDRAGQRGRRDVARHRGDRDRRRDADEDQERRHQEAAADAEHAGHEADRRAHRQDQEDIDRNVGDGEIELHARSLLDWGRGRRPRPPAARISVGHLPAEESARMRARGATHGPVAAPLHNRIRPRAGLKNSPDGNILPRLIGGALRSRRSDCRHAARRGLGASRAARGPAR